MDAYKGEDGEERARNNVKKFVEAHVVPASPWKEGDKLKTLAGGETWWEMNNGVKMVILLLVLLFSRSLTLLADTTWEY